MSYKNYQPFALHQIDSYKLGHKEQYPENTTLIYSNFTPRSHKHAKMDMDYDGKIVVAGIQATLHEIAYIFEQSFFKQPLNVVCEKFQERILAFTGKKINLSHIVNLHNLGYLPLEVKTLDEGSVIPTKIPVLTVKNTKPEFYWLVNFIETWLSAESWKVMTSATTAYRYRKVMEKYAELTGSNKDFIWWQGHDFSNRGMSGMLDAAKTGFGHLTSFMGSDSISSVDYAQAYYSKDGFCDNLIAGSVPATEHSVMCMGTKESEVETYRRLIKEVYPEGIVSIVSDTCDYWNILTNTVVEIKEDILNRQKNDLGFAKVVFRPDSGDPVDVVCGTAIPVKTLSDVERQMRNCKEGDSKTFIRTFNIKNEWYQEYFKITIVNGELIEEILTEEDIKPEMKGSIQLLWEVFGGTKTDKGYRLLDEHVGLIYGDSITIERCQKILDILMKKGFASTNLVLGIGSYTYQHVTRDTFGFAMKSTYGEVNGVGREIFKDPKTDNGVKKSAKGLLRVEIENGEYVLYDQQSWEQEQKGVLTTLFKDGVFYKEETLNKIRTKLSNGTA